MSDFRYFALPHSFSTYTRKPHKCDFCGQKLPVYEGVFYGEEDAEFCCEPCLLTGRLAEKGLFTNDASTSRLAARVAAVYTNWSPAERSAYVRERVQELKHRTPHLPTWQDWDWPVHCDDFCRFERIVGQKDIRALAGGNDADAFLKEHLYEPDGESLSLADVRPDSPEDNTTSYSLEVYQFVCRTCAKPLFCWDIE